LVDSFLGVLLRSDAYRCLRENHDTLRVRVSGILCAIHQSRAIEHRIKYELQQVNSTKPEHDQLLQKAEMMTEQVEVSQEDTHYHNTQCLTCAIICHESCNLAWTSIPGHNIFHGCACMENDRCSADAEVHHPKARAEIQ
jgi:hypothetical protein